MAVLIIVIVTKMIQKMLLIKEIEILLSELFGRIFDWIQTPVTNITSEDRIVSHTH